MNSEDKELLIATLLVSGWRNAREYVEGACDAELADLDESLYMAALAREEATCKPSDTLRCPSW